MSVQVHDRLYRGHLAPMRDAFRTVLVHVRNDPAAEARLDTAVHLARRLEARLLGLGAETYDPALLSSGYGLGAEIVGELNGQIGKDIKVAEEGFARAAAGLETEWVEARERPVAAMARMAGEADLIVASRPTGLSGGSYRQCDAGELVLKSGRPVLLTPFGGGELHADCVVVAWKDTRECRRAIADAMPILRSASEVLVMAVCHPDHAVDLNAALVGVVSHLKRHGVDARPKVRVALDIDAAAELQLAAANLGADLIVAGAYGHSRVGEWMFGGVTRDLLNLPTGFVLLSH